MEGGAGGGATRHLALNSLIQSPEVKEGSRDTFTLRTPATWLLATRGSLATQVATASVSSSELTEGLLLTSSSLLLLTSWALLTSWLTSSVRRWWPGCLLSLGSLSLGSRTASRSLASSRLTWARGEQRGAGTGAGAGARVTCSILRSGKCFRNNHSFREKCSFITRL